MTRTVVDELVELAEWDWVVTSNGSRLHHLERFDDTVRSAIDWGGPGTISCGRWSDWLGIAGAFTRMGAKRCDRCCDRVGFPRGVGSPKNDRTLRPLVEARLAKQSDDQEVHGG